MIQFLDWLSMILTILCMHYVVKYKNWWLVYFFSNVLFIYLMIYKGLWGWTVGGIILAGIGLRNYLRK